MSSMDTIRIGRGHDSQVRVTDISVSRLHASIKTSEQGDFLVEDHNSKFGTLMLVRKPHLLEKNTTSYF